MKASVIIPTKNAGAIFPKVLAQVVAQKTPWPYEIFVIDSGSSDSTLDHCKKYPQITVHTIPPESFGHGKTRNLAISLTKGEFAIMLTHDAMPAHENWLQNIVEVAESSPDIAGVFGRHIAYKEASPFIKRDIDGFFKGFAAMGSVVRIEDKERYASDTRYKQLLHFFSDNNACLRRSVWEKMPYPDVDFSEDQLWAQMVLEAGYAKGYADHAPVYHSHTFGIRETLQRSFDESYAFLRLFGYGLCPNLRELFKRTAYSSWHDIKYVRRKPRERWDSYWGLRAPFDNFARNLGHYLGQRAERMPDWMINKISRDRTLKNKKGKQ